MMSGDVLNSFSIDIASGGSEIYSSLNTENDFKIRFSKPLELDRGKWSVALTKIQYPRYIANIDDLCYFKVWNGNAEYEFHLPKWHCPNISTLISIINEKLHGISYKSTYATRKNIAAEYEKHKVRIVAAEATVKTADVAKDEYDYLPHGFIEKESILKMINEFKHVRPQEFSFDKYKNEPNSPQSLTIPAESVVPADVNRETSEALLPNTTPLSLLENHTGITAIKLFNLLQNRVVVTAENFIEPTKYDAPQLGIDTFGRVYIHTNSPEFDIGLSDELRIKLGFTDALFSIESYLRRRFFHTYLTFQSKNVTFLSGQFYNYLKQVDAHLYLLDTSIESNANTYYNYINRVVRLLLKNQSEQVWVDFSINSPLYTNQPFLLDQWSSWPSNSRWMHYFRKISFNELKTVYESSMFPRIDLNNPKDYFSEKGSLLTYYMLRTLFNEMPLGKRVFSNSPCQINYPYDSLFIYSDIIQPSPFNESEMRLLQLVPTRLNSDLDEVIGWEPRTKVYKPCVSGKIPEIKIEILSTAGSKIPFMLGPVILELQFIQRADP